MRYTIQGFGFETKERLMDYIRANKDQALAVGIDEKSVLEYIPEKKKSEIQLVKG